MQNGETSEESQLVRYVIPFWKLERPPLREMILISFYFEAFRNKSSLNWCLPHTEIFSKSIQKYSMCYGRWQSTFFTRLDVILILLKSAFDKFQCAMAVGNLFSNSSFHPFVHKFRRWLLFLKKLLVLPFALTSDF